MDKPTCKECEVKGERYSVQDPGYGFTTLIATMPGYWDEDGKFHEPQNPNHTTYEYTCSNGHAWKVVV